MKFHKKIGLHPTRLIKYLLYHVGLSVFKKNTIIPFENKDIAHFLYFQRLFSLITNKEGDVVECGIGYGGSFFKLACLVDLENKKRRIWGFDSFKGFPKPSKEDKSPRNPKKGEWNVTTKKDIKTLLVEGGGLSQHFFNNSVKLVKGFFEESLSEYDGSQIAFLHLDVDLYNSYKVCLEHLWPKVIQGGVVLFDEYKQPDTLKNFPGASKAIDEFFEGSRDQIKYDENADMYYLIKS